MKNPKRNPNAWCDHDEAALREGSLVGRNGEIDDLYKCALFGLIQFSNLEMPRKVFEDRLVVFHLAQLADVFEAASGTRPLETLSSSPVLFSLSLPVSPTACEGSPTPAVPAPTGRVSGCIRLHPLNLRLPHSDLRPQGCGRFDEGARLAIGLDHFRGLFCLFSASSGIG